MEGIELNGCRLIPVAVLLMTVGLGGARAAGFVLPHGCELPFDDIKSDDLEIDAACIAAGNAGNDQGKKLESEAKNNFCATGTPVTIAYSAFTKLQAKADADPQLRTKLKSDRGVLVDMLDLPNGKKIGEGTLVRFRAFLLDAHRSNVGKKKPPKKSGELVNCNRPEAEWNDIHIGLVKDAEEDDQCKSVTAEMSPHFRPEAWDELVKLSITRPVRITGPLFFDNSHHPCRGDKRPKPNRISVWEIHPVYQFEVCKNKGLSACSATDASVWIPFDEWHSHAEDEEEPE